MNSFYSCSHPPITSITPTLCTIMRVPRPAISEKSTIGRVIQEMKSIELDRVDRCLIYAPDAIGTFLFEKFPGSFDKVINHAPITLKLCSIYPPKTPVCFASMFTGAFPEKHGIRTYCQPVLSCETLFDVLIKAGKRVAIVAVSGSSIDRIFRQRDLDYFSEASDSDVTKRSLSLIKKSKHDCIVVYHQEFDDSVHQTTPLSEKSINAMENHNQSFHELASACQLYWKKWHRILWYAPDHGAHIDPELGTGTHGENIAEDMEIIHFVGLYKSTVKLC